MTKADRNLTQEYNKNNDVFYTRMKHTRVNRFF